MTQTELGQTGPASACMAAVEDKPAVSVHFLIHSGAWLFPAPTDADFAPLILPEHQNPSARL